MIIIVITIKIKVILAIMEKKKVNCAAVTKKLLTLTK